MVDLNEFSSIFWKVQHSHSRHQKITSTLLRITFKDRPRVSNERSLEGALYTNLWIQFSVHGTENFSFCKFLKILMVSEKTVNRAFRIHKTLLTKPIGEFFFSLLSKSFFFFFLYLPNLYFGFNPILTGLFESKFLLGGGPELCWSVPGAVNLTPPVHHRSDLGPKGADRREILHGCQDTCKENCYSLFLAENGLLIMLLWFMQIRCIIITYLLIFPLQIRNLKANFWQKVL